MRPLKKTAKNLRRYIGREIGYESDTVSYLFVLEYVVDYGYYAGSPTIGLGFGRNVITVIANHDNVKIWANPKKIQEIKMELL